MTTTTWRVAIQTDEAYTHENVSDAARALAGYAATGHDTGDGYLTLRLTITAPTAAEAATIAQHATLQHAAMHTIALEVAGTSDRLHRLDD